MRGRPDCGHPGDGTEEHEVRGKKTGFPFKTRFYGFAPGLI